MTAQGLRWKVPGSEVEAFRSREVPSMQDLGDVATVPWLSGHVNNDARDSGTLRREIRGNRYARFLGFGSTGRSHFRMRALHIVIRKIQLCGWAGTSGKCPWVVWVAEVVWQRRRCGLFGG
jgi:hypothetical protein